MADNDMKRGMLNIILMEIRRKDCKIDGVSYDFKDKFILPKGDKLYFVAIVKDTFGTDTRYSYSVAKLDKGYILVLDKGSEEYKEVVEDLPDCVDIKHTSSEPFKKWKYDGIFEDLVDKVVNEDCLSKENRNIYIDYLYKMGKIKDNTLYDYFIKVI